MKGPGGRSRTGASVLIVDDDNEFSQALSDTIKAHGYDVSCAPDGGAALEMLGTQRPRLILADLLMPVMTGSKLLQELRKDPLLRRIPYVIVTGVNDPMIGLREDAQVLYKPVDEAVLLQLLRQHCDAHPDPR